MQMDLSCTEVTPKRCKEYNNIFNTLMTTQVMVKSTAEIRLQQETVKALVVKLSVENVKLALVQYRAKSAEIRNEINKLMLSKLKHIPDYAKLINYVMPSMCKRRFSDKIVPLVRQEMQAIINDLNSQLSAPMQSTSTTSTNVTNSNAQNTFEMETSNSNIIDLEMSSKTETRKRKCSLPKSKSISSLDSYIADIDADSLPKQQPIKAAKRICDTKLVNNVVHTMQEAYNQYQTFAPANQQLPELANPPDTARQICLPLDNSADATLNFITSCVEIMENSSPKHSLVTLHSPGNVNHPKSHLRINISPECLRSNKQDIIPEKGLFVYELLLLDQSFEHYKLHLEIFLAWARHRQAPILLTVPIEYTEELKQHLEILNLHEIPRPFHPIPSTSITT
jgi:hypothetical protein